MNFTLTEEQLAQMRGSSRDRSAALFDKWYAGKSRLSLWPGNQK